jgi:hypothetical protein
MGRAAIGGVLGVAAAVLTAPGWAATQARVTITPPTVVPGGTVTVTVACGAAATAASVNATSFGGPSDIPLAVVTDGAPGAFSGTVTVPRSTVPGTYDVSVTCTNAAGGTGKLVVSPAGGVTGGGGSTSGGANGALIAAGAGMILLAGTGGWILVRRRASRAAAT